MSKIFESLINGSLIDNVNKTKGTLTAGTSRGFIQTDKGLALEFDGSTTLVNYGDINDITTGDFSLESYIKIKSISATQVIFGKRSSAIGYAMRLTSGGLLQGVIEDSGGATTSTADGTALDDNSWHHLIITFDRDGNMTRYVDGLLYGTADDISSKSGTLTNAVNLQIGASGVPNQYFNGYNGKAKLYDHILTAQERAELYSEFVRAHQTAKTKRNFVYHKPTDLSNVTGLTSAYNMIPQNGVLTDISGNSNNGTINGALSTKDGMSFDEVDDYINIDTVVADTASDTVGTWLARIKLDSSTPTDINEIISFNDTDGQSRVEFAVEATTGVLRAFSATGGTSQWFLDTDANPFVSGEWSSVALVQDGTEPVLYVDGVAVDQSFNVSIDKTNWIAGATGIDNARIGNRNKGSEGEDKFFGGEIQDVKIYNRVLTLQEVKDYHNSFAKQVYLEEDFKDAGADGVNKLPRGWIAGTGSYKVDELAIEQGELAPNRLLSGTYTAGIAPNVTLEGTPAALTEYNGSDSINGQAQQVEADGVNEGFTQSVSVVTGKKYKIEIRAKYITSGNIKIVAGALGINETLTLTDSFQTFVFEETASSTGLINPAVRSIGASTYVVDIYSVTEIPPLQNFDNGTTYLENTSAGNTAIPSKQAYGTWEFDLYKGADGNTIRFDISDRATATTQDFLGYRFTINSSELIGFVADSVGGENILFTTATSYITNNTWYRIKITRTTDGEFTVYIRGGAFGDDDWTLVDVSGGTGTNPVTDTTHTTSSFTALDFDSGDRITNFKFIEGVEQ